MTGLLPYQTALVDSTKAADLYNIHQVLQHAVLQEQLVIFILVMKREIFFSFFVKTTPGVFFKILLVSNKIV